MWMRSLRRLLAAGRAAGQTLRRRLAAATGPAAASLLTGALADLARTKTELLAENAFLRQQLLILRRRASHPRCTPADRALLGLLARRLRTWPHALFLVQPDFLLRWHRLCGSETSSEPHLGQDQPPALRCSHNLELQRVLTTSTVHGRAALRFFFTGRPYDSVEAARALVGVFVRHRS